MYFDTRLNLPAPPPPNATPAQKREANRRLKAFRQAQEARKQKNYEALTLVITVLVSFCAGVLFTVIVLKAKL